MRASPAKTLLTTGLCVIAGEITTSAVIDYNQIARQTISVSATTLPRSASTTTPARCWLPLASSRLISRRA